VGASIGLVPLGPGDGDAQQVMTHADLACYAAKDMGRNRIHVYTTGDTALARRRQEMVWAGDIRHALAENRLRLYAQPIVPTVVGKLTPDHYEVLVRLLDATGREIMPEEFIPAAERFGVMSDVDRWVIASAFAWLAQREPSAMPIHLCINLSGTSLGETWLPAYIEESWRQYSLDARQICFEITETAAVTNLHDAVALMERLRGQGIQFALDDFGSGLSSFNYLKTLPVDYLKIDGSIVRNVVDDPIHRAMVEAINHVGHVMGKKTIAEFVENDSIRAELVKLGVDFVQGYGIGMPVPLSSLP
jgi:EAL domain-containing protein (putative c-di-GMP-specific phosphodiesterase class I)